MDPALAEHRQRSARVVAGVDLGTTNVVVRLHAAETGTVLAESRCANRQIRFGADVLSRISAAIGGEAASLAECARASLAEALGSALRTAGVSMRSVHRIVVAGNTAMISLLTGADVSGLGSHPFAHALAEGAVSVTLPLPGIDPPCEAEVVLVPPVAAFVGGDLVAGLTAAQVSLADDGLLYIDLGTNAEVAAVAEGRCWVTSAPAGPAFEGWGIACGGQAGAGGIVRVRVDDAGALSAVFEGERPSYLTGSGLISALALLRRVGHLGADGLLRATGPLETRFFDADGVPAVTLAPDLGDRSVFLDQRDVRGVQSAKAAVTAAVRSVARAAGLSGENLSRVVVAGVFGGAVAANDLVDLGIVPASALSVLRHVPDAVVAGAGAMALDSKLLESAEGFAAAMVHVDLARSGSFADEFMSGLELSPYDV